MFGVGPSQAVKLKLLLQHSVRIHSMAAAWMYKKPGAEKAICTVYVPFHVQGWKAFRNAPSNTFLSRRFLSGVEVADFIALPQAKLPAGCRVEVSALAVPCQWEPLVPGLSGSWSSFNRKITFLNVPADCKL